MAFCFVAGAALNVAVAWGCAIWSFPEFKHFRNLTESESQGIWDRHAPREWAQPLARFDQAVKDMSFGVSHDLIYASDGRHGIMLVQTGWPFKTVQSAGEFEEGLNLISQHALRWPVTSGWLGTRDGAWLPYAPIWSGMVINTVFYAASIWLLIRSPIETRRRLREWQGRCGHCGYPIGISPMCTECGSMIVPTKKAAA